MKHKADFTLLYNEKSSKSLKKEQIGWEQSKVFFISSYYTTYQPKAIEFKDIPIELWEIKKYSNNTILFNQIQAPEMGESITKIGRSSQVVKSVSNEIVTYSEDYHLEKCDSRLKDVYKELKELILSICPTTTLRIRKNYIAFLRKRTFVSFHMKRSWLLLYLGLKKGELNDPKHITLGVPDTEGHYNITHYSLRVTDKSDLGYILTLIKQAYDKN